MVHVRIGSDELTLSWDEWESRVASGRIPPDAMVRFDAVTGAAWTPASDLEMYRSLADSRSSAFARWQAASGPPLATALLVGVQVRIWWLAQLPDVGNWAAVHLTKWTPPTLEDGEVWRVVTMGLLHTSFGHALMNLLWLGYAGYHLERALGWRHLVWLYGASVVVGSTLSMVGAPDTPSLGASGGVFGLVAAAVVFGFTRPELLPARSRRVFGFALLPYLVLMFLSGMSNSGTDNWAHLGGLLTGGVLALVADPPGFERRPGWSTRWHAGVGLAIVVLLAVMGLGGPWLVGLRSESEARWIRLAMNDPSVARHVERDEEDALHVQVPVGWSEGSGGLGRAWHTPLGERSWAAQDGVEASPITVQALADAYIDRLDRMGWRFEVEPLQDATVAGTPGGVLRGTVLGPEPLDFEWQGAVRGIHTLQTEWRVEPGFAGRLAPLARRLQAAVAWDEPPELTEAREAWVAHPDRPDARRRLGAALAAIGDPAGAIDLQTPLATASPPSRKDWLALLQTLAWYPQAVSDRSDRLDAALAAGLDSQVLVAVADVLVAADDRDTAVGLLELAWVRAPGDRTLARARARLGLSNDLGGDGTEPASLREDCPWHEALTGIARGPGSPTLSEAAQVGAARRVARQALVADAVQRATQSDPSVIVPLVALALGHAPVDAAVAVGDLRVDLEQAASGVPPAWWTEGLPPAAMLRDLLATVDEDALAGALGQP